MYTTHEWLLIFDASTFSPEMFSSQLRTPLGVSKRTSTRIILLVLQSQTLTQREAVSMQSHSSTHHLHGLTTGYKIGLGKEAWVLYLAHMHNFLEFLFCCCCSTVPLFVFSSIPNNSLSVSMMVMSIVSRRISPT